MTLEEKVWIDTHGMEQLGQLSALEMNQDRNQWSSSGLYAAANTVIIVAIITALNLDMLKNNLPLQATSVILLSLIGALTATAWFLITVRSHTYETLWIERSYWLERKCQAPTRCSIWTSKPPEGISGWNVTKVFIWTFYWIWIIVASTAASFWANWIWTELELILRFFALLIPTSIILGAGLLIFLHYHLKALDILKESKKGLLRQLWPPEGKKPID